MGLIVADHGPHALFLEKSDYVIIFKMILAIVMALQHIEMLIIWLKTQDYIQHLILVVRAPVNVRLYYS